MKSFAKLVAVGFPVLTVGQATGTWQSNLTPKELKKLGVELDHVQKKAKHEEKIAQRDATEHPEDVAAMQQEYAHKMAGVLAKYERMAADNADGAAGLALMLATNPAPVNLDATDWMVKLEPKMQADMHHELGDLKKQGEHDLSLAKKDIHPKDVHAKIEKYEDEVSDVIKKYKKKAGRNAILSFDSTPEEQDFVSSEGLSLFTSWMESLTPEERAELNLELSKNQKDGKIQLSYAKEYGQGAVADQEKETREHEHEILMKFEKMHGGSAAASLDMASTVPSSSSPTPTIMASAVAVASGGIVTALIVAGRSGKFWTYRESTEPLISSDHHVIV